MRSHLKYDILRSVEFAVLTAFFGFVPVLFFLLITLVTASALFGTNSPWPLDIVVVRAGNSD
mgnify:CR=1 FL=1